jgi:hypothetical protein
MQSDCELSLVLLKDSSIMINECNLLKNFRVTTFEYLFQIPFRITTH